MFYDPNFRNDSTSLIFTFILFRYPQFPLSLFFFKQTNRKQSNPRPKFEKFENRNES